MSIFKKGKKEETSEENNAIPEVKEEKLSAGDGSLKADVDRVKIQVESFKEIRTVLNERINHMTEQIGEIRSMLMEKDRDIQQLEAKALKAIDLVDSVKPDKLLSELKKEDAKIEALKANIESNDLMMKKIMEELADVRSKMSLFKGTEQIIKMEDETKTELIDIKKVEATISRHADKVETMFMEMQKRFKDLETFKDRLNSAEYGVKQVTGDMDTLKIQVSERVKREEIDKVFDKLRTHIENIQKSSEKSTLSKDLDSLKDLINDLKM